MRRIFAAVIVVLTAVLGIPAAAQAATGVELLTFDRMSHGSLVQATVSVTCDPLATDSTFYLGLTLWQGSYLRSNYVEGFGGIVDPTQPHIVCDGTAHIYSFSVTPTQYFSDKWFKPGPAGVEYATTICTPVDSQTTNCVSDTFVRTAVKITP